MVQFSAEERSRVPLAALLSLTMKAYGCEYDDHATSGPLLCCMFDTIQIRPHMVALGNAHKP